MGASLLDLSHDLVPLDLLEVLELFLEGDMALPRHRHFLHGVSCVSEITNESSEKRSEPLEARGVWREGGT